MTDSIPNPPTQIGRVLIANRGEIALRIAEAAASLQIDSVAVYAPVDATALHTSAATTSRPLPTTADPIAAYLDIDAILAIASETGCDAVHPGYGFLAENADFAQRCADAGLTFIGPSPAALRLFGDKVQARHLAEAIGVPVVPGTPEPVADHDAAHAAAFALGYPVMLKAAAGGGGRGMRAIHHADDLGEALDRCRSEAQTAFGDDAVFIEKLIERPRHIEVQILADASGNVLHLWERDCSVQQRNQKVIEIAPAAGLHPDLRERILADAVRLVQATGDRTGTRYVNAATVEFLVAPESGAHYFIECNPRVQVEHTVTEEVTGIDIVEAQFHLATGSSLADLGLATQADVPWPRGFAVQARVVATGIGTIGAYKEPGGRGVRVDGCGYAGLTPPPQFDPLLAKVITTSGSSGSLGSALDRCQRALADFQILGLPTNLASLQAIVTHADVRLGDARTNLLNDHPELVSPPTGSAGPTEGRRALLDKHAPGQVGSPGHAPVAAVVSAQPMLVAASGHAAVAAPGTANVVEVKAAVGDLVSAGAALVVLNAMKMETVVTAPAAGRVVAMQELQPGELVGAGQVVAVIDTADTAGAGASPATQGDPADGWAPVLGEVRALQNLALERLSPGSTEPGVVRQRNRGKLDCRQRIDLLFDAGSFREVGSLAGFASYDEAGQVAAFTPANHVGGWGDIDGRQTVVCADDFTSRGGHADGAIGEKSRYLDRLSIELRVPSVRLLDGSSGGGSVAAMVPEQKKEGDSSAKESTGAITAGRPRVSGGGGSFLPGHLGVSDYTKQLATVPVVNVLLGSVVGIGAAKAVLGHFSVMVRDISQLFVAGPPVVSHAMGYEITKEDLGDWRVHCTNGSVDNLAESEEEALDMTRRFLSYLPSSVYEPAPRGPLPSGDAPDRRVEELFGLIPRKRTTTYDVRRGIELMADSGSFFELGSLWGTDQVTGLARFDGYPVGIIASDSRHVNGGALTADGCDKLTRFIDLCDVFHLPLVNLVDNPGFAVGLEHEQRGTIRKGGEWMVAFSQFSNPIFSVIMRRSFGVAGNHYATPRSRPNVRVVWPAADVGGIPPEGGIEAAYKRQLAESTDPAALRAELNARIEGARGPVGPLSRFQMEEMIDPRDTRRYLCEWVPQAYRILGQADRLGPRALMFRP